MGNYEKPTVIVTGENIEGVYLASGDHLEQCRFGRTEASAGSEVCQECSKSGGKRSTPLPGEESARREDFVSCVDNMPVK